MFNLKDRVRVLRGPHTGMIGTVVGVKEGKLVTQYAVKFDNRKTHFPMSQRMLEPAIDSTTISKNPVWGW